MGSEWFGKGCDFLSAQWDCNDSKLHGYQPVLVFCNHKCNPEGTEGNCRKDVCPLLVLSIKKPD